MSRLYLSTTDYNRFAGENALAPLEDEFRRDIRDTLAGPGMWDALDAEFGEQMRAAIAPEPPAPRPSPLDDLDASFRQGIGNVLGATSQAVGQASDIARGVVRSAVPTTTEISGGGRSDAGGDILSRLSGYASTFGDEARKALAAVLVTEGGMTGAVGDTDRSAIGSHGPLQFYGSGGQLNNFARAHGISLQEAARRVKADPDYAVRWALDPSLPGGGYMGRAIRNGLAQGLGGPALATFIQRTGQVSESPERAGANWSALFGGGNNPLAAPTQAAPTDVPQQTPRQRGYGSVAEAANATEREAVGTAPVEGSDWMEEANRTWQEGLNAIFEDRSGGKGLKGIPGLTGGIRGQLEAPGLLAQAGEEAFRTGLEQAGVPGRKETPIDIGPIETSPAGLGAFAAGVALGGPGGKGKVPGEIAEQAAEEVGKRAPKAAAGLVNRFGQPLNKVEEALDRGLATARGAAERPEDIATILGPRGQVLSETTTGGAVLRTRAGAEAAPVAMTPELERLVPNFKYVEVGDDIKQTLLRTAQERADEFEAFRRGTITERELVNDLAPRLGMTADDFMKAKKGTAYNAEELITLRAAVVTRTDDLIQRALDVDKRGIGDLSDKERVELIGELYDAARLQMVGIGAKSEAGRALRSQRVAITSEMARAITGANEAKAIERATAAAQRKAAAAQERIVRLEQKAAAKTLQKAEQATLRQARKEAAEAASELAALGRRSERVTKLTATFEKRQQEAAARVLEKLGGRKLSDKMLATFIDTVKQGDPMATAKFLKGLQSPKWHERWGNRISTLRYASMLSSTATHMTQAFGNASQSEFRVLTKAMAVPLDVVFSKLSKRERLIYAPEIGEMQRGLLLGFRAGMRPALEVLKSGISPMEATKLDKVHAGFGFGKVGAAIEMPLRLMVAGDVVFRTAAFSGEARALAVRQAIKEGYKGEARGRRVLEIIGNLEEYPEIALEAEKRAARVVLQEGRAGVRALQGIQRLPGKEGLPSVGMAIPFVRTPYNIAAQGAGMTPAGLFSVMEGARAGQREEATERVTRAIFGTAVMGWTYAQALDGNITAAMPETAAERAVLPKGWQPWSFRVINPLTGEMNYVSYQNWGPFAVPLAIAAIAGTQQRAGGEIELGKLVAGIGNYLKDQTFLRGVSDIIDAIEFPDRHGERTFENIASQFVPYGALNRQIQRALGMAERDPEGAIDAMLATFAPTAGMVRERTDVLGEPVEPRQTGLSQMANPLRASVEQPDELRDAYRALRDQGYRVTLGAGTDTVKGIRLDADQERTFQAMLGPELKIELREVIGSSRYRTADPGQRAEMLDKAERKVRDRVGKEFYGLYLQGMGAPSPRGAPVPAGR